MMLQSVTLPLLTITKHHKLFMPSNGGLICELWNVNVDKIVIAELILDPRS